MDVDNVTPSDAYEGLKKQYNALKTLYKCQKTELSVYRKRMKEFNFERIIQLEAELESQKEMNAILTKELNQHGKD